MIIFCYHDCDNYLIVILTSSLSLHDNEYEHHGMIISIRGLHDDDSQNVVSCYLISLAHTLIIFLLSTDINMACDCIYLDAASCHDSDL